MVPMLEPLVRPFAASARDCCRVTGHVANSSELSGRLSHAALEFASRDRDGGAGDLDLGSVGADVDDELSGSPEVLTLMDGDGSG